MKRRQKGLSSDRPKKRGKFTQQQQNKYIVRSRSFVQETKYFDFGLSLQAISTTTTAWTGSEIDPATLNTLFAPAVGNNFNQREGRKTYVKKIKMNCLIFIAGQTNQTATESAAIIRVILYMDKQTNATQSQGEDLMASGAAADAYLMFQNPANFGRFRVLKDKTITMQSPITSYDGTNMEQHGLIHKFKMNVNFIKPLVINFNNTNGATVADIVDHSFHMIAVTNATGLAPSISYQGRIVFCE